jgi:hypothetical protein
MHRIAYFLIGSIILNLLSFSPAFAAWPWSGSQDLVTINAFTYTPDDFRQWWKIYRGDQNQVPEDLDTFVEWKLLAQEARASELDSEPNYLNAMGTFYKARTRLLLKYDTVDSKINITEEQIRQRYQNDYVPRYRLSLFYFETEQEAAGAAEKLAEGEEAFAAFRKMAGEEEKIRFKQGEFLPKNIENMLAIRNDLKQLAVGQVSKVYGGKDFFIVFRLDDKIMPAEEDFLKRQEYIKRELYKEKEAELTDALFDTLKRQYEVKVDEEVLAMANKTPPRKMLSTTLVETNRENIPLYPLVKDYIGEKQVREAKKTWSEEEEKNLLSFLLNGIIFESILTWAAEDRKYDEIPPFKYDYQFRQESTLIKDLERLVIRPGISVSDEEVESYYREHLDEFTPRGKMSLVVTEGEAEQLRGALADFNRGYDFNTAGLRQELTPYPLKDSDATQIDFRILAEADKLGIGEVSQPFAFKEKYAIVRVVAREVREPQPLAKVGKEIAARLSRSKFSEARKKYVAQLLQESDIKINGDAWEKLLAEYTP